MHQYQWRGVRALSRHFGRRAKSSIQYVINTVHSELVVFEKKLPCPGRRYFLSCMKPSLLLDKNWPCTGTEENSHGSYDTDLKSPVPVHSKAYNFLPRDGV